MKWSRMAAAWFFAGLALLQWHGVASAQDGGSLFADPFPSASELRIEIRGTIAPRCDMSVRAAQFDVGELVDRVAGGTRAGSSEAEFQVSCNSPFHYELRSENGGLASSFSGPLDAPFRRLIEYDVLVETPLREGVARGACRSVDMVRAPCVVRVGRALGVRSARLLVSWPRDPRPPVAGRYQDRVFVRVIPNLGGL